MTYVLLNAELVETIHNAVLNPGELAGRALDKSLDGALGRVDNRLVYGMIEDTFDLAAAYCVAVATGHVFNDANKRTAYKTIIVCLHLNGIRIAHDTIEAGDLIREVAQGRIDEETLADWLRAKAG
ncbi:type II toxin-antitoxin system death-on-curing family toxin [Sulfitobacter sp. 1A13496]|uniref:type II toxin-antitoxin system death-on-curing family toxin n=1 Tax=Sulfitobacter sp. 1A13496 TaxID=3368596 RepID=UPI0037467890